MPRLPMMTMRSPMLLIFMIIAGTSQVERVTAMVYFICVLCKIHYQPSDFEEVVVCF